MTLLGAILAGGASRRFGSDKAAALWRGVALLDHVAARLRGQCDALVVIGREWPGLTGVADVPAPGLGPLGGLAGALAYGLSRGHAAVLTSGCDLPDLPLDLAERLVRPNAVAAGQPLLGLWETGLAGRLAGYLAATEDRSLRGWVREVGAREADLPIAPRNVNRPDDLLDP